MTTLGDVVRRARLRLTAAGIDDGEAALDAELLARDVLQIDRAAYVAVVTEAARAGFDPAYEALVGRRATREPMGYVRGVQEFWGRDFLVSPAVLIPRPETELIIEEAAAWAAARPVRSVLDIGTGSGCLAITLVLELSATRQLGQGNPKVIATDISADALALARANAERLIGPGFELHLDLRHGAYAAGTTGPYDLIVSNPPYVRTGDLATLAPEVRDHEPRAALDGGVNGLDAIADILRATPALLAPAGGLLMEIGYDQAEAVRQIVADTEGLLLLRFRADLQNIPRVAVITRE